MDRTLAQRKCQKELIRAEADDMKHLTNHRSEKVHINQDFLNKLDEL